MSFDDNPREWKGTSSSGWDLTKKEVHFGFTHICLIYSATLVQYFIHLTAPSYVYYHSDCQPGQNVSVLGAGVVAKCSIIGWIIAMHELKLVSNPIMTQFPTSIRKFEH